MSGCLKVLKFGGSSLGTVDRIVTVAEVIAATAADHPPVVIVSALEGVTNRLVDLIDTCDHVRIPVDIEALRTHHMSVATPLLSDSELVLYEVEVDRVLRVLSDRLKGLSGAFSTRVSDEILATGERLSAPLVAGRLRSIGLATKSWDSTRIVRTDSTFGEASLDWVSTAASIKRWYFGVECTAIVTGFIGSDGSGRTTTLGRGGSDYSAAIFASALNVEVLERWTDVDGVYTDDPRQNPEATRLQVIDLQEGHSWTRADRIGMHRRSFDPVAQVGIPVHVRSTLEPEKEGTWIVTGSDRVRRAR